MLSADWRSFGASFELEASPRCMQTRRGGDAGKWGILKFVYFIGNSGKNLGIFEEISEIQ